MLSLCMYSIFKSGVITSICDADLGGGGGEIKKKPEWSYPVIQLQFCISSSRIQFMEKGNLEKFKVSSWECWTLLTMNK